MRAGSTCARISVSITAGAIAVTYTPPCASSLPIDFVSAMTAPFDAE